MYLHNLFSIVFQGFFQSTIARPTPFVTTTRKCHLKLRNAKFLNNFQLNLKTSILVENKESGESLFDLWDKINFLFAKYFWDLENNEIFRIWRQAKKQGSTILEDGYDQGSALLSIVLKTTFITSLETLLYRHKWPLGSWTMMNAS